MPPRRARSGVPGKTAPAADTSWETGLKSAQFEECWWKACVSLLAGGTPADEELMGPLQLAVQQPQRRLFTLVSQEAIVATIHHLGNPKAKRPKDVPMFHEMMEQAKVLLDAGQEGSEEKSKAGPASATKHKASDNRAKEDTPPAGVTMERQTKLRRRGEDIQTPKYIDDEPEGGPQHYFLLTGFLEAQLLPALEAVGLRVDNVIRVQQERGHYNTPERRDSSVVSSERPRGSQKHCVFWSSLGDVLDRGPALSTLQDVARLCYTVLQSAKDSHLCVDSFHNPLDNTLYIICHSPRSPQRHCCESWETVLHTDVAFRNYQEHVANVLDQRGGSKERGGEK
ncbi:hypothetical protein NHX12_013880 [Muraenolepis orangiensis]|uniref:Uncharacterized protein n=1 Tax=Muraenolepis orangiensis TaxID=630683 RepID=A0A9Q0I432_9TELE|nr:hypothetical protein NHX12_013880 [Muraenolepis orangiensis]